MDELQISGKRFISSRRLARDNGYTADYLGQLIRGGKVVGQKVGRAWYVDAASFDMYLGGEGISTLENPIPTVTLAEAVPAKVLGSAPPQPDHLPAQLLPSHVEEIKEIVEAPVVEPVEQMKEAVEVPVVAVKQEEPVYHVPLHIIKKEELVEEKKEANIGGLRYFADNEPSLPEIRVATREPQVAASVAPEAAEEKIFATTRAKRSSKIPVFALAGVAVVVFIISAFVSSAVSLNLSIEGGNTANVSYSLPW